MGTTWEEIERSFRARLKTMKCIGCGESITDAAIDWGYSQPNEYAKDGPHPLKCEHCGKIQNYSVFSGKITPPEK